MTVKKLKLLSIAVLMLCLVASDMQYAALSNYKADTFPKSSSANRVLYLTDSWDDVPKDLRDVRYGETAAAAEIRKVEVESDSVIICANGTQQDIVSLGEPLVTYLIFFDTNNDSLTEISWRYQWISNESVSTLYRFSDKAFYYNGSWHPYSYAPPNFEGKVVQNSTTGETFFHLQGVINGTVRIKVASMTKVGTVQKTEGDLVPGYNYMNTTKMRNFGPPYTNACDVIFPYSSDTVELKAVPKPPPPPPPPEMPHLNIFVQMAVWAMQASVWIKNGILNSPFWMRDNAVSGSLIVTVVLLSFYSLIKKRRIERNRLKKLQSSLRQ